MTKVGSNNHILAYSHLAHNVHLGNHIIMSNVATLAGHVTVEDQAVIGGLALSSIAYALAGAIDSYWVFIAMYGVAGLGNTVFHPSDYSLLSQHAPPERLSHVFSFHTFAGMVGSAIAPATLHDACTAALCAGGAAYHPSRSEAGRCR